MDEAELGVSDSTWQSVTNALKKYIIEETVILIKKEICELVGQETEAYLGSSHFQTFVQMLKRDIRERAAKELQQSEATTILNTQYPVCNSSAPPIPSLGMMNFASPNMSNEESKEILVESKSKARLDEILRKREYENRLKPNHELNNSQEDKRRVGKV